MTFLFTFVGRQKGLHRNGERSGSVCKFSRSRDTQVWTACWRSCFLTTQSQFVTDHANKRFEWGCPFSAKISQIRIKEIQTDQNKELHHEIGEPPEAPRNLGTKVQRKKRLNSNEFWTHSHWWFPQVDSRIREQKCWCSLMILTAFHLEMTQVSEAIHTGHSWQRARFSVHIPSLCWTKYSANTETRDFGRKATILRCHPHRAPQKGGGDKSEEGVTSQWEEVDMLVGR